MMGDKVKNILAEWVSPAVALGLAIAVPILAFSVFATVGEADSMLVESVEIVGTSSLTDARILEAAGLSQPRPLLSCDAEEMEESIEALPLVRSASVRVGWDGAVLIAVDERVPAGVILSDVTMLLDSHGEAIRPATEEEVSGYTLFVLPQTYALGWSAEDAMRALAFAEMWRNATGDEAVEIHYDPALGWRVRRFDDVEFVIGTEDSARRVATALIAEQEARANGRPIREIRVNRTAPTDAVVASLETP